MRSSSKLWLALIVLLPGGLLIAAAVVFLQRRGTFARWPRVWRASHASLGPQALVDSLAPAAAQGRTSIC